MAPIVDDTAADAADHPVAIRVENVTKIYGLWSSPGARLGFPLLGLMARAAKNWLGLDRRIAERRKQMFREFRALEDVSLEIKKGESWGIIGVNGSGKSTLLKIISGNLTPTGGRVEVDGKVAILDYSSGLHGSFTGRENVYMKGMMLGLSRREMDEKFESILAFAEIGDFIDQPVKTYSSGMTARLGFAILAHVDADIVITDEALAVGDAFFVQKSMNFLRSFLKRGTFLFVSHSTGDIVSLCEKAAWLENGRIRSIGTAKEVTDAYLSSRTMDHSRNYLSRGEPAAMSVLQADDPGQSATRQTRGDLNGQHIELAQPALSELTNAKPPRIVKDPRLEFLNRSPWRNDIKIPDFASDADGFGVGGARIEDLRFEDQDGAVLSWVIGGEMVLLKLIVLAEHDLSAPIVGFQVRDRLGQTLFADNTYLLTLEKPFLVRAGQRFEAEFEFQMPLLPPGEYGIRPAVALGTEEDNAMLHCIDTGLSFAVATSGSRHGLVGVPMHGIRLGVLASAGDDLEVSA